MSKTCVKIKKIIGRCLYYGIGRWLPGHTFFIKPVAFLSKKFRGFCGKLILDKCGKNVNICNLASFSSKIQLGDNSGIGIKAKISGPCIIGNNVIMAPEVSIFTVNHCTERIDIPIKYKGDTEARTVNIGDDSWIGYRAIILPGVTIGKGVVVGAGAVVTKDVPDYAVVAGNPARVVKIRGAMNERT